MLLTEANEFNTDGAPVYCMPYGGGHINMTYLVLDDTARLYIMQKINRTVFRDPQALMENIVICCDHLAKKGCGSREALRFIPGKTGKAWYVDENGEYWRMYAYISDCITFQAPGDSKDAQEIMLQAGKAIGQFLTMLADLNADQLSETIPNFHNTPARYRALDVAISEDVVGVVPEVTREIDFALARRDFSHTLVDLQKTGVLPTRVIHNDTKINNVLFDRETRKSICVIDFDTVMPGLVAYDFGDAVRFGANTAAEDERDLSKVSFSLELYHSYAKGFLSACGDSLSSEEKTHLPTGAVMMTLECGVRFLTDYLCGNKYFKVHYPTHNLDRCRVQFKLVQEMENNRHAMLL